MFRDQKMRAIRSKRALSPAISSIIMITITVTVSVVVAFWMGSLTMNLMSLEEFKIIDCEWANDLSYVDMVITNHGTHWIVLSNVRINGIQPDHMSFVSGSSKVDPGDSAVVRVFQDFNPSTNYRFRVLTARGNEANYVDLTDSTVTASLHYIDALSNVDDFSDQGSHSNFVNQQSGPDSVFDILTEGDYGAGLTKVIQYANSSISDVDGSADFGTELNSTNAQDYVPDSYYMTLQEDLVGGGGGVPQIREYTEQWDTSPSTTLTFDKPDNVEVGDLLLILAVNDDTSGTAFDSGDSSNFTFVHDYGSTSSDAHVGVFYRIADGTEADTEQITSAGNDEWGGWYIRITGANITDPIHQVGAEANGYGNSRTAAAVSTTIENCLGITFTAFDGGDGNNVSPFGVSGTGWNYEDDGSSGTSGSGDCAGGWGYKNITGTGSSIDAVWSSDGTSDGITAGQIAIACGASIDYELDFEYQWTSADYDEEDEEVCIYIETASQSGENLVAYEWTGANWQTLGTLNSDGWNNFTTSYLTGAAYTINIRDDNKSNDVTQSAWNIDCIITDCRSTDTNYKLDIEVQFTDINVGRGYNEICIYMGSASGENLDAYIWNGASWDILVAGLVENQWNNITRSITEDTVTLKFLGTLETNDLVQDNWEIDCSLLYAPVN